MSLLLQDAHTVSDIVEIAYVNIQVAPNAPKEQRDFALRMVGADVVLSLVVIKEPGINSFVLHMVEASVVVKMDAVNLLLGAPIYVRAMEEENAAL